KLKLSLTLLAFLMMAVGCGAPETESTSGTFPQGDEAAGVEAVEEQQAEGGLELPEGFPSDFPLPPNYDIYESRFVPGDPVTRANYLVRGRSSADLGELVTFYRDRLPQAGFKVINQPPESALTENATFYFQDDTYSDCSVQMRQEEGLTDVLINLPLREG
ncbi:MAG: hypothetical protein LC732_12875, partial [Acidobacteria bacterium]|nr:hypothetical protein [Acidobacteriota bacterium]